MSATSSDSAPATVAGCLEACTRCVEVVDAVIAHDGGRPAAAWKAVAPHLRHCVEHFRLLFRGLPEGRVDYDARARDTRLESDPQAMRDALAEIASELSALEPGSLDRPLVVLQTAASGRPPVATPSCLDRELAFLSGHTIHHIAILGLAADAAGASLPPRLAVAFSTEAYRNSVAAKR